MEDPNTDNGLTLAEQFAALRRRIEALGQARDVSIALTHLDTAEKWARDYGAQPADKG